MRRLTILFALGLLATACMGVAPSVAPSAAAPIPNPTDGPGIPAPATSEPGSPAITATAEDGGLRLEASFDRIAVEAGGVIEVALSIENTRPTDVRFEEPCGLAAMTVSVPVPVEPVGRTWTGIAATFKTYALEQSTGSPMESSVRTLLPTAATPAPCHAEQGPGDASGVLPTTIIPAGTTYTTTLRWTAELVRGVAAMPGSAAYSIKVLYDPRVAGQLIRADTLELTGTFTILDGRPSAVSAGQALDAAIGDPKFAAWLRQQPAASWVNANLYLQPGAIGVKVLPAVPYWAVELFREPRNWAIYYVDAIAGGVLKPSFCDIPCDR